LGKGFTRLWAGEFEGERMDGDGSSSDLRGGQAGVCADVEGRGVASEGDAGTGRRAGRRVERASRRWRAALCTAAAGGRNCSGGRSRAGEQEGSEEEDERGKRPRTHMQN
jgi:hypothetical protein